MTLTSGKVVLSNPLTCTNTAKGENKLYSDAKGVVPSLDLRFAEGKNLNDYMTGQNLITFSRSSIGTYVDENGIIQTATADTPRFDHDPTTGESLGLLIEESRTNLFPISENYTSWNVYNIATKTTDGTTIAGLTAVKLTSSVDTNALFLEGNNATFTANTTYTTSVYHKPGNLDGFWFEIRFYAGGGTPRVFFDSTTETWSADSGTFNGQPWSVKSQKVESNAWRHSITFYIATDTAGTARIGALGPVNSTNVSTGDYGYIAAPQIEAGSFPTSYIPTTGTALTRSADVASITGTNFSSWYNQSEGSFYYEGAAHNNSLNGVRFVSGTHPRSFLNSGSAGNNNVGSYDGTNSVGLNGGINWQDGTKAAVSWSSATRTITKDGQVPYTAVSNQHNIAETQVYLNRSSNGTSILSGTISRLTYFPERLPDSSLQTMTQ